MKKMYIVKYSSGSYEDYCSSDIFVTDKKSKATKYCTKFNTKLKYWQSYFDQFCEETGIGNMRWIKDVYSIHYDRWQQLSEINNAYWEEVEVR